MYRAGRGLSALLLLASAGTNFVFGQTSRPAATSLLRLKSGKHFAPAAARSNYSTQSNVRAPSVHFIAIFKAVPSAADAQALRDLGYRVLAFVPDNGLMVFGSPNRDLSALGVTEHYTLEPGDKLSAKLDAAATGALAAVIEMQPDVEPGFVLPRLIAAGAILLPNPDLNTTEYLVRAPYTTLQKVAKWDEAAYIYPASPQMTSGQKIVACSLGYSGGALLGVAANLVPTFGDGWAGATHGAAAISFNLHTGAFPLAERDIHTVLQSVLQEWSAYAAITFTPKLQSDAAASIDISFVSGEHGDGFPFRPFATVLAHTFYPPPNPEPIAGDMHLNVDEAWSLDGSLQLYAVMLHEMGHALGLGHSDDSDDVMYPYYQATQHLAPGDIRALQTLYAAPTQIDPAKPTTPTIPDLPRTLPVVPLIPNSPSVPTSPSEPDTPIEPPGKPNFADTIPPFVQIYSPSMSAILSHQESLTVQGFATDNVGVTEIRWSNSAGGSGSANLASPFVISGIALVPGVNRILIQASDEAGNVGSAYLTVTRK